MFSSHPTDGGCVMLLYLSSFVIILFSPFLTVRVQGCASLPINLAVATGSLRFQL